MQRRSETRGDNKCFLGSTCVTADPITAVRFVQMGLADSSHGIRVARGAKTLCPYWSDSFTYDVLVYGASSADCICNVLDLVVYLQLVGLSRWEYRRSIAEVVLVLLIAISDPGS